MMIEMKKCATCAHADLAGVEMPCDECNDDSHLWAKPMSTPRTELVRYIKPDGRNPRGALVAVLGDGIVRIGWSFCHPVDRGRFSKARAKQIARDRATTGTSNRMPYEVQKCFDYFVDKCITCFDNAEVRIGSAFGGRVR